MHTGFGPYYSYVNGRGTHGPLVTSQQIGMKDSVTTIMHTGFGPYYSYVNGRGMILQSQVSR